MQSRVEGFDLIRSLAILIVFVGHIVESQSANSAVLLTSASLSPGLTMSLLGFISAALLSTRELDFGPFLIKRFTRIYISLILCLTLILGIHALIGKLVVTQHIILHAMGLSAFFDVFLVQNKASIGSGLWFITAIIVMYFLLPVLQKLFLHPRGRLHLFVFVTTCVALNLSMYGTASVFNVAISFAVGTYFGVTGHMSRLTSSETGLPVQLLFCAALLALAALATAHIIPYGVRSLLFALYPLAFVPLLFSVASMLPKSVMTASTLFAGLSYEFYILHFYFINEGFKSVFGFSTSLYGEMAISLGVTCVLAYLISKLAAWLRKSIEKYLLAYEPPQEPYRA